MTTKFDDNVAREMPKTKDSAEPGLPWKLSSEEIDRIEATDQAHKTTITNAPPLHVRAIFVVLLVVAIFVTILNSVVNMAIDNSDMQVGMAKLEKVAREKTALSENAAKLEKRVNDLSAQKELYTAVIETLTKKTDEPQAGSN